MAGELILYTTDDGASHIRLRADGGTVWLSQLELAELFQTSVPNINIHIKNVLEEGELSAAATIKEDLIVREEGSRQVRRPVKFYNLDMILAVGYRVRSLRGTQFRQWATTHLREYLIKGFVMDDERLKQPGGGDYFDELLKRIRDIRASEKRFYQKVSRHLRHGGRLRRQVRDCAAVLQEGSEQNALGRDGTDCGRTHLRPRRSPAAQHGSDQFRGRSRAQG